METAVTIVRSAQETDRSALANIIHFEPYVHRHLDYRHPLEWIGRAPFLVLCDRQRIQAALACPPDPLQAAWIRLFAANGNISLYNTWSKLWGDAWEILREQKIQHVVAIPLHTWFEALLRQSGFINTGTIVMLQHDALTLTLTKPRPDVLIRPMTKADMPQVLEIDRASFDSIWTNSLDHLETTFEQALVATIAVHSNQIAGYQISTNTTMGCHLARLAVKPAFQGLGIGYALICDLLESMQHNAGRYVTVNTQEDNLASLTLYKKAGFSLTGENYPIYRYNSFSEQPK